MLLKKEGIGIEEAHKELSKDGVPYSLQAFADRFSALNLPSSVLVDCSASENVAGLYHDFLSRSISVVTPNKRAQSASMSSYKILKELSNKKRVPWLFETSVGAGLPVISTLSDLIKSGDKIVRIEGVLSGTLSYIFSNFSTKQKFSELVLKARKAGYTEPDPREDLNGQDVGRKILILARESGVTCELEQVEIENLVPIELRELKNGEEFLQRLPDFDTEFHKRAEAAEKNNKKLRYIAVCDLGAELSLSVSLQEVGPESPFWALDGTDNMVSFTTERYSKRPLVVRGPGAGAEVTAAGVFADIIRAVI
jgi:aspartokinase/homoserine dehydrogenase 1